MRLRYWFHVASLLTSASASLVWADRLAGWRFYTSADGLRESYVRTVTVGPSGRVWINHGAGDVMGVLDGYKSRQVPSPGPYLTVREGVGDEAWAMFWAKFPTIPGGMQRLWGDRWERFPISQFAQEPPSPENFLPVAPGRVLILLSDRLLELDASTGRAMEVPDSRAGGLGRFLVMERARDGGIWIGAERGLAWVSYPPAPFSRKLNRKEHALPSTLGFHNVLWLREAQPGNVVATVVSRSSGRQAAVQWDGAGWRTIATAGAPDERLRVWSGSGRSYWIARARLNSFRLFYRHGAEETQLEKVKGFSGSLFDVAVEPSGAFWIATNAGLARHAPPAWRRPATDLTLGRQVSAIHEDSQERLFFLLPESLLVLDGAEWRRYPFPANLKAYSYLSNGLASLNDGRIAVATQIGRGLLIFDPDAGAFELIQHPAGLKLRMISARKGGGVWVAARSSPDGRDEEEEFYRLEAFDGRTFQIQSAEDTPWRIRIPRHVLETSEKDLWLAGLDGDALGLLQEGRRYRSFSYREGHKRLGSFCILEMGPKRLWVGLRNGIAEFDGENWRIIRTNMESVRSMIRAWDGSIWAASGSGLHRFSEGSWMTLNAEDGLPDGAVYSVLADRRRRIWVGTTEGLSVYHPDADRDPPETLVEDPGDYRKRPPAGETRFVVSGIDKWNTTKEDRLLYSYRIDRGPWSSFRPDHVIFVEGVEPGDHQFEARAMDRNWNVDPTPARYPFTVLQPWYSESGFLAVSSLSAGLILFLLWLHIGRHLRLEALVAERTAALSKANDRLREDMEARERAALEKERLEAQLLQARKMEAIGRLAGGIAHDFNNLLTVINGYANLLLSRLRPGDPLREGMAEIRRAGERGASLTRQLLSFSRKQVVQPELLDLNVVIRELERMLRQLIGADIHLVIGTSPNPAAVNADKSQVEQVVVNLAVNARDAMPRGGKLTIQTARVEMSDAGKAPRRFVSLTVADTGVGMNADTREKIFEPFFTTKERDKGTGIGLPTVHSIVEQAGGFIQFDSEAGEGTTFRIYFPEAEAEFVPAKPPDAQEPLPRGEETILLVEDEDALRALIRELLSRQGYHVLEAANGNQGLEKANGANGRIQLIVTDIVMPEMGGREMVERLRPAHPRAKVLYISGYTDDSFFLDQFFQDGMNYLQKPFEPSVLLRRVRDLLGSKTES